MGSQNESPDTRGQPERVSRRPGEESTQERSSACRHFHPGMDTGGVDTEEVSTLETNRLRGGQGDWRDESLDSGGSRPLDREESQTPTSCCVLSPALSISCGVMAKRSEVNELRRE